ncbi:hypothetical protein BUALT_Bualt05G0102100 [Buddleja alternifolia]|uniref:Protein pollen defective in guidance 1 n=1 Tax=Buddleja alternifolia TaxID=168488 RepID=A0AAV6XPV9_9LAMI|nr:hypothetical protein BUALT_Bualt05G0102100 [Buddleja alternifolia]
MPMESHGRKLSFDILAISEYDDVTSTSTSSSSLSRSKSDPPSLRSDAVSSPPRKRKKKRNRKGKLSHDSYVIAENAVMNRELNYSLTTSTVTEVASVPEADSEANCAVRTVTLPPQFGELRQRNVGNVINGGIAEVVSEGSGSSKKDDDNVKEEVAENVGVCKEINSKPVVELNGRKLERDQTLDWKNLMPEDPNYTLPMEKSPMKYFMEEMYAGNSLRSTTTLSNEKERERVYDTIFRLPWRCELLINIGLFVCIDSFLSLLTIMPTRIIMTFWRLIKTRQFKRPSSLELSDFGCFIVLIIGVTLLQQAVLNFCGSDISLIYHMIRGQGIIKLYVVYNVLEVFDKLCQSFGGDVIQALFNSADGLANCSQENMQFWMWRFIIDEALAVASSNILMISS